MYQLTIFHHITELLVLHTTVICSIELNNLLDLGAGELGLLANGQGQATHKLVFSDDARAEFVIVLEEFDGSDAVLVYRYTDTVKNLLKGIVCSRL